MEKNVESIEKIVNVIGKKVYNQLEKNVPPNLEFPLRSLSNTKYVEEIGHVIMGDKTQIRKFNDLGAIRPFTQTFMVAKTLVEALKEKQVIAKRDVYYTNWKTIPGTNRQTFDSQQETDMILTDIELMTGLLLEDMGVVAESKGAITGDLRVKSRDNIIDCSAQGDGAWFIPSSVGNIQFLDCKAKFVLVVEKGTVFQRLNSLRWWREHNCLLVHGRGQPDRATRRLVKRLNNELKLPVYILVDSDPYGFSIFGVYKHGSIGLAFESERLACTEAQFLGVSVSDLETYNIPKDCLTPAKTTDLKRAKDLLKYPWFQTDYWTNELNLFLKKKVKAEIETLSIHGLKFLVDNYLPEKLGGKNK